MKGKYNGRMMIYGTLLPGARTIAWSSALTDKLTEKAKYKIKILDWHKSHGENQSLTARHFGIGRMTLHRWITRFKKLGVIGLNELSTKPKNVRRPASPWHVVARIVELRKQYPAWSKHKLAAILKRENIMVSESTVGRILKKRDLSIKEFQRRKANRRYIPKQGSPRG